MTNSTENFTISNVEINDTTADQNHVCFDIKTEKGEIRVLEWLNDDGIERTDSHIITNELEKIEKLFDLSEKPIFMPTEDYIPLDEIFDAVDEELQKLESENV